MNTEAQYPEVRVAARTEFIDALKEAVRQPISIDSRIELEALLLQMMIVTRMGRTA